MAKTQPDVTSGLNWLGTILSYVKEYGVWNMIKAFIMLVMLSMVLRIMYNPEFLFDKYREYSDRKHADELVLRAKHDQMLKSLLPTYLYKYHADRVWIIQYHNGVMDWQHGTMRFELCAEGVPSIKMQYDGFNLTWLDLPYYLQDNEIFIGDLSDLQKIDPVMCQQFIKNRVGYIACTLIRDSEGRPMAVLGVTWNQTPDLAKCRYKIHDYLLNDRGEIKILIQANKIEK